MRSDAVLPPSYTVTKSKLGMVVKRSKFSFTRSPGDAADSRHVQFRPRLYGLEGAEPSVKVCVLAFTLSCLYQQLALASVYVAP